MGWCPVCPRESVLSLSFADLLLPISNLVQVQKVLGHLGHGDRVAARLAWRFEAVECGLMRYVKAALTGLIGGALLAVGVTVVDGLIAMIRLHFAMKCVEFQCFDAVQFGSVGAVLTAFVIGFLAMFGWFLRGRRVGGL